MYVLNLIIILVKESNYYCLIRKEKLLLELFVLNEILNRIKQLYHKRKLYHH